MKSKFILILSTAALFFALFFAACSKSEGDGITPSYSSEATSTGGNPNSGAQTST